MAARRAAELKRCIFDEIALFKSAKKFDRN